MLLNILLFCIQSTASLPKGGSSADLTSEAPAAEAYSARTVTGAMVLRRRANGA